MAEALLANDHFYVNASYFNETDSVQPATIMVQDNTLFAETLATIGWCT